MKRSLFLGALTGLGLLALPAAGLAAVTCPPGVTPPSVYCTQTVPTILNESVVKTTTTAASVQAQIDAQGADTTYVVQYGRDITYGFTTPILTIPGSTTGPQAAVGNISGLAPNTTYHFRFVASNSGGITYGSDFTFRTKPVSSKALVRGVRVPRRVKAGHRFTVSFVADTLETVRVSLKKGSHTLASRRLTRRKGRVSVHFRAPRTRGKYVIVIQAQPTAGGPRRTFRASLTVV